MAQTNYLLKLRYFTYGEDEAILKYIIQNKLYKRTSSSSIWKEMEKEQVVDRSWQAMRARFLKIIIKNLNHYSLSQQEKDKFLHSSQAEHQTNEAGPSRPRRLPNPVETNKFSIPTTQLPDTFLKRKPQTQEVVPAKKVRYEPLEIPKKPVETKESNEVETKDVNPELVKQIVDALARKHLVVPCEQNGINYLIVPKEIEELITLKVSPLYRLVSTDQNLYRKLLVSKYHSRFFSQLFEYASDKLLEQQHLRAEAPVNLLDISKGYLCKAHKHCMSSLDIASQPSIDVPGNITNLECPANIILPNDSDYCLLNDLQNVEQHETTKTNSCDSNESTQ